MTSYGLDSSWNSGEQVSRTRQPWGSPHSFLWLSAEASDICPEQHSPSASPLICLSRSPGHYWFMAVVELHLDRLGSKTDQFSQGLAQILLVQWSVAVMISAT